MSDIIVVLDNLKISFISRSDLIQLKEASGRPQEKVDVNNLKKAEQLDARDDKNSSEYVVFGLP